jgi:hypothetical protein
MHEEFCHALIFSRTLTRKPLLLPLALISDGQNPSNQPSMLSNFTGCVQSFGLRLHPQAEK